MRLFLCLIFALLVGCGKPTIGMYDVKVSTLKFADRDTGPLVMDVYSPNIADDRPAIIWYHGGAFAIGNKEYMKNMCTYSASLGYVSISPEYRMIPQGAKLKDIYQDAADAYKFVKANASTLGINCNRISVGGDSAGAHLALLVGLREEGVKSIVDLYGSSDLLLLSDQSKGTWKEIIFNLVMDERPDDDPQSWADLSPINFVNKNSPPILILHGTKDSIINFNQSSVLRDKVLSVGGKCIFAPVIDAEHGWVLDTWGNTSLRTLPVITQFLANN